jgi:uncharacterized membrane protein YvlD (DUF360 family)
MNISIVLAQVLGIMFVVMGLSMLFQKKYMLSVVEELVQSKSFMWIGGFMALTMGAVMITLNNVWTSGLPLVITVLGWLALIKGAFFLLLPDTAVSYYKKVNKEWKFVLAGLVVLILGLVLLFYR